MSPLMPVTKFNRSSASKCIHAACLTAGFLARDPRRYVAAALVNTRTLSAASVCATHLVTP